MTVYPNRKVKLKLGKELQAFVMPEFGSHES